MLSVSTPSTLSFKFLVRDRLVHVRRQSPWEQERKCRPKPEKYQEWNTTLFNNTTKSVLSENASLQIIFYNELACSALNDGLLQDCIGLCSHLACFRAMSHKSTRCDTDLKLIYFTLEKWCSAAVRLGRQTTRQPVHHHRRSFFSKNLFWKDTFCI